MDTLFIFFLNHSFLDLVEKNKKTYFLIERVPPVSVYNLKWRAKFQIYRLPWLNFIQFSGYKFKIRLVSILREDQALIWISTILKFSALIEFWDKTFLVLNPGIKHWSTSAGITWMKRSNMYSQKFPHLTLRPSVKDKRYVSCDLCTDKVLNTWVLFSIRSASAI